MRHSSPFKDRQSRREADNIASLVPETQRLEDLDFDASKLPLLAVPLAPIGSCISRLTALWTASTRSCPGSRDRGYDSDPLRQQRPQQRAPRIQTHPSSSHGLSRRQHVEGEGNSSGKNRHAAPVWRIHRMPSKQARLGAGGRPRRSARCLGGGSKAPTNSQCSSLNSFCRSFMTEAQPTTCLTHKYLT